MGTETKKRHLRLLVNVPTRDILKIHKGLAKQLSLIKLSSGSNADGKIWLQKFLHKQRIPGVEDKGCDVYRQEEQTVYHILLTCQKFRAEKMSIWKEEEKKYV